MAPQQQAVGTAPTTCASEAAAVYEFQGWKLDTGSRTLCDEGGTDVPLTTA